MAHSATLHGSSQLMLSYLVRRYWIIGMKSRLKSAFRRCIRCLRFHAHPVNQQMAPLPAIRVTPGPAFETTGLDYAGPFPVRTSKRRGQKAYKGYVAIFICMVTRAVHMEVVSDYSSKTFLLAYDPTARRGTPRVLYSDNGTTFHGADSELQRMFTNASSFGTVFAEAIASDHTTCIFIPPRGPHFGGLWEAAVKSFKFHLKHIVGDATLTFEEFSTFVCRIESCLNSRPLCPISSDSTDVAALTPGHFLIGCPLRAPPAPPVTEPIVGVPRWHLVQAMQLHFWHRWRKKVLNQMQTRSRWLDERPTPSVEDLVLLTDDQQPALHWPFARVIQLHPRDDGLTRVITLKTATSTFRRPISRVIALPLDQEAIDHHRDLQRQTTHPPGGDDVPASGPASSSLQRPASSHGADTATAGGSAVAQASPAVGSIQDFTAGGPPALPAAGRYHLRPRGTQQKNLID